MALAEAGALEIVILAAGKGTRMKSVLPKVLHKLCGQTLVERTLRAVAALKPERIVLVVGYEAEKVVVEARRVASLGVFEESKLMAVVQEQQLGTGHAAQVGLGAISDTARKLLFVPGDDPLLSSAVLKELVDGHSASAKLSFLSCVVDEPGSFGRVIRDSKGKVARIVEARDCTKEELAVSETNTSIYLGDVGFISEALASLKNDNAQGEFYLTDIVGYAVEKSADVNAVVTENQDAVTGANSRFELSMLEQKRREEINKALMDAGVTIEDPSTVYVDEGVEVGKDCFLGAGTRLRGRTKLAEGVYVEGDTLIDNSSVGARSRIRLFSYIEDANIAEDCMIGPMARIRPGSELAAEVKIGNFVETKKASFGKGAKASHLSYIGDAEVGVETNIGAGTITCNYDGARKHKTTLGDRVFIGSNTALVAPVTVSDGAYVGAGSVITKDIPKDSLGVARARQNNIDGWASKRAKK